MRVLICGATGVIGQYLVPLLVQAGHEVTALVQNEDRANRVRGWGVRAAIGDILTAATVLPACVSQDVVVHAATRLPRTFPGRPGDFAMNDRIRREGTANLLTGCEQAGVKRVLLQSIIWVHGDQRGGWIDEDAPLKPGILARSAADLEAQGGAFAGRTGAGLCVLRCGAIYAAEAYHTQEVVARLRRRLVPIIAHGDNYQCFVHAADVAAAFALAVNAEGAVGPYFVTDDEPMKLGDYLRWLAAQSGASEPHRIPHFVARMTLGHDMLEAYEASLRCRNQRLRNALGWTPRYPTVRDGYAEVLPRLPYI